MRRGPLLFALLALAGCAAGPDAQVSKNRDATPAATQASGLPAGFEVAPAAAGLPSPGGHGTEELAATFLDLSFRMESGRSLPVFSRFERPVSVALTGDVPALATADLSDLIDRLRREAGIDIRAAAPGETAAITVDFQPRALLRQLAPSAACFVVPNVGSLTEYRAARGTPRLDWAAVTRRDRAAIFVPSDTSPQEVRDCLHEELAQALGPLNDLYQLSDSVFNDDNFHAVLTPFDMLMLRATYAPDLASGMTRAQVAARIGPVFARLNPGGASGGSGRGAAGSADTPRSWTKAIETALSAARPLAVRRAAADRALAIARAEGWQDSRLAFSHFAAGRLRIGSDRARAAAELGRAAAIYARLPGGAVQRAHVDMQLAAIALAAGQPERTIRFADRSLPVVRASGNQALRATLLLLKAEAHDLLGQHDLARRLRLDSLDAARYGFGSEAVIQARMREIATFSAQGSRG